MSASVTKRISVEVIERREIIESDRNEGALLLLVEF